MFSQYYYKTSPFYEEVNGYLAAAVKPSRKEVFLMDTTTHELLTEPGGHDLMRLAHIEGEKISVSDSQQYLKLFVSALPLIMNLSSPGLKVFIWILLNIKPKQDRIALNPKLVAGELQYGVTKPVYDGIKDLLNSRIIAKAYTGNRNSPAYWINPTMFYNGNRRHLWNGEFRKQ